MSEKPKESEQPKAPEKTIYQRDKTAKEPTPLAETPKPTAKPKPKIKKVFVLFLHPRTVDFYLEILFCIHFSKSILFRL